MRLLFFLLCFAVVSTALMRGSTSWAEAGRCEWAECTPSAQDSGGWTVGGAGDAGMPVCGTNDKAACAEECRKEFDSKYKRCIENCLAGRCVTPTPVSTVGLSDEPGSPCVEIESPICSEHCAGEASSRQPRCRRDCLQRACPSAPQLDITKESLEPGSFRCERCRKKHEISCNRQCALGMIGTFAGIERWGCEKACLMSYCSKSCGGRLQLIP